MCSAYARACGLTKCAPPSFQLPANSCTRHLRVLHIKHSCSRFLQLFHFWSRFSRLLGKSRSIRLQLSKRFAPTTSATFGRRRDRLQSCLDPVSETFKLSQRRWCVWISCFSRCSQRFSMTCHGISGANMCHFRP